MQGTKSTDGTVTGAAATGNGTVMYPCTASDGAMELHTVQVQGINGDTVTFEAYLDEVPTWVAIQYTSLATGTAATSTTADGIFQSTKPVSGLTQVRARLTRVNGTVVIWGVLSA